MNDSQTESKKNCSQKLFAAIRFYRFNNVWHKIKVKSFTDAERESGKNGIECEKKHIMNK